jgi:hypothetical protein
MKNCYYDDDDDACIHVHMVMTLLDGIADAAAAVVGVFQDAINDYYRIRDILSFQLLMHLSTSFSTDILLLYFLTVSLAAATAVQCQFSTSIISIKILPRLCVYLQLKLKKYRHKLRKSQ